jgi:hypothetical protein
MDRRWRGRLIVGVDAQRPRRDMAGKNLTDLDVWGYNEALVESVSDVSCIPRSAGMACWVEISRAREPWQNVGAGQRRRLVRDHLKAWPRGGAEAPSSARRCLVV